MKVYINRQPVNGPWGGGNMFVKAFHKVVPELGHELVESESMTVAPDVVLLAGLDNDGSGVSAEQAIMYKIYREQVKVVLRVNENDARKGTTHMDEYLLKLAPHVDATIFVSDWLKEYFESKGWPKGNSTVIVNGVDKEVFKPQPKLNNGKLNIVAHHWSDNQMKGFDIYEQIDELVGRHPDKLAFTYIGRDRRTFKHTNVVRPLFGKKLGEELGKHDVYVSASRFDPGPNHILEALACGLPTYVHKDGGGCVEFAGYAHAYGDWEDLKIILESGPHHANIQSGGLHTWQTCVREYVDFLNRVVQLPA